MVSLWAFIAPLHITARQPGRLKDDLLSRKPCSRNSLHRWRVPVRNLAGFGAKPAKKAGKKSSKTNSAIYNNLIESGATEFAVFTRKKDSEGEWKRVGTMAVEGDEICRGLTLRKRIVLEHAKKLHPALGLVKTFEMGYSSKEAEEDVMTAEKDTGEVVAIFKPDVVPGSMPYYREASRGAPPKPMDLKSTANILGPRKKGERKTPES